MRHKENYKIKNMRNLKLASVILFTFLSTVVLAGKDCKDKIKNADVLTQEQIALRIKQCEDLQPKRDALKATFTAEQKAIRKDKSLSKKEKKRKIAINFQCRAKGNERRNKSN